MKAVAIVIVYCYCLCWVTVCRAKRGFILTAPKAIDAGGTEYFTFTAFDVPPGGQVTLKLLHWYTGEQLAESKIGVHNNINMWVEMTIPPSTSDVRAKLQVNGTFSDGYRIDAVKEVLIRHKSVITFVQTDKPVYKPEQTVRFRVLPLDGQLKPLEENTVGDIWIEDPSDIRVAQWKQVHFKEGMVQLELPLSNEPPLGTWSIKSTINQVSYTQKFNVEKYVLPKFEVKVHPPAYVMADADVLPVEVCAWYTYGKKVDGVSKLKVTYKKYAWERRRRVIPSIEHSAMVSGCHTFNINTQDILLQTREFGFRTIEVFAEVVENGTATMANASATVDITHSMLDLKFLGTKGETDYFKPGIPFYGELSVKKPNGVPAANEKVEICAEYKGLQMDDLNIHRQWRSISKRCHLFTSNKKGLIRFSVPPKSTTIAKIHLVAVAINYDEVIYPGVIWHKKIDRPQATLDLMAWYSPSDNHMQIQPFSKEMECEKLQRVKVRYTADKGSAIKFYHQVLSRGRIVQQGSHQRTFYSKEEDPERYDLGDSDFRRPPPTGWLSRNRQNTNSSGQQREIGEFLLSFDPRATMSPIARLLVFYVREDGEIVADSRMFRIAHCLLNKVNLDFRHEQQFPSTEASMLLSASPSSVCGIGLVDKSVRLLSQENQFRRENVFKVIEKYDVGKDNRPHQVTEDYCIRKEAKETTTEASEDRSSTAPSESYRSFHPFSRSISHHSDTSMAFEEAGMVVISNFELETRPCTISQPVAIAYNFRDRAGPPGGSNRGLPEVSPRMFAPQSVPQPKKAIIDEEEPPKKVADADEIRSYFPETWLWEMHTVGSSGQMVLKRELPHTITEWIGGAVCVHPKTGLGLSESTSITAFQPFFVSFQLPYSVIRGEVLPLVVSVFNYLSECLPIKLSLEPSEDYKTFSKSRFHRMCVCGGKSESHRFAIKPVSLGLVNITVYGFSLEADDEATCGNEVTARLSARDAVTKQLLVEAEGFPKEEVFNYFVCPENTNGSFATEVDLLLPEDVVEGSARAYVSVTGDLMGPALNGISNLVKLPVGCGEQNMVLFTPNIFVLDYLTSTNRINEDIRSSCINNMKTGYQRELQYRHKDGSYSAFGARDPEGSLWLTAFVLKSFGQARRFVDVDDHDLRLSTAWILEKQFENGCFEPSGFLLNKAMKGGLSEGDHSLAPLTAYVLISLLESGAQRPEQPAVRSALKCLESENNPNSYALALFAYASALAKETPAANRYLQQLDSRAIVKDTQVYWEAPSQEVGSKSVSVEIAGYYILGRTEVGGRDSAVGVLPVVRWIIQQRNSHGGFVSTQDTVVALQALARYSSLQSTSTVDMGLVVESDELVRGFKLEEDNKLVTQTAQVPVLPAVVDLQGVGVGCALVQFSLKYNVEKLSGSQAFDLNIETVRQGSSNCNLPRIGICMRYKIPGRQSNMVVVSVKMASGFVPNEWSLYELQSDPTVQLKRHEIDGNQVNLYFNELGNRQKCFFFHIKSEIEVEDIKPSSIKLYDYYQPELEVTKDYTIPLACVIPPLPTPVPLPCNTPPCRLAWSPPLIIDTDNDLDIFPLPSLPSEIENISTDMPPEDTTISYVITETFSTTLPVPTETVLRSSIDETITQTTSSAHETINTFNPGYDLQTHDTVLPSDQVTLRSDFTTDHEITESISYITLGPEQFKNTIASSIQQTDEEYSDGIAMADDASVLQSHLTNFIDVEEDLDFPEGIEGNRVISVQPPTTIDVPKDPLLSTENVTSLDCPVCEEEFPENFTQIYCSSAFALRVIIRDGKNGTIKILQDLSFFLPHPKAVKQFALLQYGKECYCPHLHENGSVHFILGPSADLWDSGKRKHRILLTNRVYVISPSSKTVQPEELTRARNRCDNEP